MSGQQIIDAIRREPKVPAPSQTVFRVLECTKDPNCDVRRVAGVIHHDAALTAHALRQANSALYGFSSTTSSVNEACMRLGLKRVRSAVINQHVICGLGKTRPPGFDSKRYWQTALAISVAAQDMAEEFCRNHAEDASTAGLLCDIGIGLLAYGVPERYKPVLEQVSRPPARNFEQIETQLVGVTHSEVGQAVLKDWGLDEAITQAVRMHHADPLSVPKPKLGRLDRVIAAAATLARIAMTGPNMEDVAVLFAQIEDITTDSDGLVNKLLDTLGDHIRKTAQAYAVDLGPTDQMESNFEDLIRTLPDVRHAMFFRPAPRERIVQSNR